MSMDLKQARAVVHAVEPAAAAVEMVEQVRRNAGAAAAELCEQGRLERVVGHVMGWSHIHSWPEVESVITEARAIVQAAEDRAILAAVATPNSHAPGPKRRA